MTDTTTTSEASAAIATITTDIEGIVDDVKSAEEIFDDIVDAVESAESAADSSDGKLQYALSFLKTIYSNLQNVDWDSLKDLFKDACSKLVAIYNQGAILKTWISAFTVGVKAKIKELIAKIKEKWESLFSEIEGLFD